ncbi:MAG: FtsH protease activity modulator HflK [Parvularculaceae bacterium]
MPWNSNGGNQGPWGRPPSGGGRPNGGGRGPGAGGQPPDLEELIRQGQQRLKRFFPGGRGGGSAIGIGALVLVGVWLFSGIYQVEPAERGVVLRFGEFVAVKPPGLHYHLPYPIETVRKPQVTTVNRVDVGFIENRAGARRDVPDQSLMLTGDENIVDIDFSVFWRVDERAGGDGELPGPAKFLYAIDDAENAVRAVAEAAMREVVGRNDLEPIITRGRDIVADEARELIQQALDEYGAGVLITEVNLLQADPPGQVIDAFRDVANAAQDKNRTINEANAYRNRVVPEARGDAQQILEEARAYQARVVAEARGQADRFIKIYDEYARAPDVTRQRMYLETMERVLGGMNKVVIDEQAGSGVVPYLPLTEIQRRRNIDGGGQ